MAFLPINIKTVIAKPKIAPSKMRAIIPTAACVSATPATPTIAIWVTPVKTPPTISSKPGK